MHSLSEADQALAVTLTGCWSRAYPSEDTAFHQFPQIIPQGSGGNVYSGASSNRGREIRFSSASSFDCLFALSIKLEQRLN
jgi:hypothetical protein